MATFASKLWMEHGALNFVESVGDDVKKEGITFPEIVNLKKNETVLFSWTTFKSREHRDKVNASVMADTRMAKMFDPKNIPFDMKRVVYGGFKVILEK